MGEIKSSTKDNRTRNWTFIVYPESAPENWRDIIDSEHIPWVESPLHEGEMNPDNETEKKSHWHILLLFAGKKSFEQVKEITDKLSSTMPQVCKNAQGLVRYMAHLDNPEKKQYEKSKIISHGGANVASYLKATGAERYQLIGEMSDWVEEHHCTEFNTLFVYARKERFEDWFPLLCDNSAYVMQLAIKSIRHNPQLSKSQGVIVDKETGEIFS